MICLGFFSKTFHSLIQIALQGGSTISTTDREEAFGYYSDVLLVISERAKVSSRYTLSMENPKY